MFGENNTDVLNELYRYSDLIQGVSTAQDMENLSISMAKQLEEINVEELNPFVLHSISHNLCSKFLVLAMDKFEFPDSSYYLLGLMFDRKMILPVYQSRLSAILSKKIAEKSGRLKPGNLDTKIDSSFKFNMECLRNTNLTSALAGSSLVKLDCSAERYINRRFGYSLLDLEGNFLWSDENSLKFFELRPEDLKSSSFFEMMIPHSKQYLLKKFGQKLLPNSTYGTSIAFSYVIYSKNSANKFVKQARKIVKKPPRLKKEVKERTDSHNKNFELYFKYLKSLSSKATLIALTFSKCDLSVLTQSYGEKLSLITDDEKKLIDASNEDSFITKDAILIETRLSRNIPNFPYSDLENEKYIQVLKDMIESKLRKKDIKLSESGVKIEDEDSSD